LSGIARKVPSLASSTAENPGMGWPENGTVTPLSAVMNVPDVGPGWYWLAG
jgi:hypothetical protein